MSKSLPVPELFMVMYSPDSIPDKSSVVIYSLRVEKGKGNFSLTQLHDFHNHEAVQTPQAVLTPTEGCRAVMYLKHKGRLQIFEKSSITREGSGVYNSAGRLPYFVGGYFFEKSSAMTYGKSILQKVCDDKLKTAPLRELNRASILRRLFAEKYANIVLNLRDLDRIITSKR